MKFIYQPGRVVDSLATLSGCRIVYGSRSRKIGVVTGPFLARLEGLIRLGY